MPPKGDKKAEKQQHSRARSGPPPSERAITKGHLITQQQQARKGGAGEGGRPEHCDRDPPNCKGKYEAYVSSSATVDFATHSIVKPLPPSHGLHTTIKKEFDAKKAEAIAAFTKIVQACGSKKFFDKEFFLGRKKDLYPPGTPDDCTVSEPEGVTRIEDLYPQAPLFSKGNATNGVSDKDIAQGSVGDCFLISAILSLAAFHDNLTRAKAANTKIADPFSEAPDPIQRIFVAHDIAKSIYAVMLYCHGAWQWVIVDGVVPTDESGKRPLYARCAPQSPELWPLVLEKAYIKFHGSADSCDGGFSAEALVTITGGVQMPLDVQKLRWTKLHELGTDPLNVLGMAVRNDVKGDGGAAGNAGEESGPQGLFKGHAYAITAVSETTDKKGFVQSLNPWQNSEWRGDWSDTSKLWKTPHGAKIAAELKHTAVEDGKFWMCAADVQKLLELDCVSFSPDSFQTLTMGNVYGSGKPSDDLFVMFIQNKEKVSAPFRIVLGQHAARFAATIMGTEKGHPIVKRVQDWEAIGHELDLTVFHHPKGAPTPQNYESATKRKIAQRASQWTESVFVDISPDDIPVGPQGSYVTIAPQVLSNGAVGIPYYIRVIAPADADITFFQCSKGLHGAVGKDLGHIRVEKPKPKPDEPVAPTPAPAPAPTPKPKPTIIVAPSPPPAVPVAPVPHPTPKPGKPEKPEKPEKPAGGGDGNDSGSDESSEYSDYNYDEEAEEYEECAGCDGEDYEDSFYGSDEENGCWDEWEDEEGEEEEEEEEEENEEALFAKWFASADENGDNVLEKSEVMALFCQFAPELSPSQVMKKIKECDVNGDNKISKREFVTMAKFLRKHSEDHDD